MKTKHKKSAKILSLILSLMLMVGMTQVVLAAEDSGYDDTASTSDEAGKKIDRISIAMDFDYYFQNLGYKVGDIISESDLLAYLENDGIDVLFEGEEYWSYSYHYADGEKGKGLYAYDTFIPCEMTCGAIDSGSYYGADVTFDFSTYTVESRLDMEFDYDYIHNPDDDKLKVENIDFIDYEPWAPLDYAIGEKMSEEDFVSFINGSGTINISFENDYWDNCRFTGDSFTCGDKSVPCEYTYSEIFDATEGEITTGRMDATFICGGAEVKQSFYFEYEKDPLEGFNIKSFEIVKLPDKVFTRPFTLGADYTQDELLDSSISYNMQGAQLKVGFTDGSYETYTFGEPQLSDIIYMGYYYTLPGLDYEIGVRDLGNYQAEITIHSRMDYGVSTTFTVNHGEGTVLTDSATGITVSGNVGEGVTLNVKAAEVAGAKAAFDITLVKDGKEVQPAGDITVSIPYAEGGFRVVWVKDDKTQQDMNATYENGKYVFTSNHLSTYAIVASSTSTNDTATKDTLGGGTSTDNGTVQTGDTSSAAIIFVMLLSATAVMFFAYRRRLGR